MSAQTVDSFAPVSRIYFRQSPIPIVDHAHSTLYQNRCPRIGEIPSVDTTATGRQQSLTVKFLVSLSSTAKAKRPVQAWEPPQIRYASAATLAGRDELMRVFPLPAGRPPANLKPHGSPHCRLALTLRGRKSALFLAGEIVFCQTRPNADLFDARSRVSGKLSRTACDRPLSYAQFEMALAQTGTPARPVTPSCSQFVYQTAQFLV